MPVISEQVESILRLCVPYSVMLALYILNVLFLSLPLSLALEPPLILMMIFYWSVYRPTLVPVWLVFLAGVMFDFLGYMPVGLHAFIFVAVRWLVTDQRLLLASQSFLTVWIGFIVVNLIAVLVQWLLFGLINFEWTPIEPAALMFASGVLFFPMVSLILHMSHRILPEFTEQFSVGKKKK